MESNFEIIIGDALEKLTTLSSESVDCIITSPPYWWLRDYKVRGQIGMEKTIDDHISILVSIFREARRTLKKDGTFWLNYGDMYAGGGRGGNPENSPFFKQASNQGSLTMPSPISFNIKKMDLIGLPWLLAFALRNDGWWLRSDIVWHKTTCMPESVGRKKGKWTFKNGRPTRSHEYLFLFTKSKDYYYDSEAIAEPCIWDINGNGTKARKSRAHEALKSFPTTEHNGIRNGGGFKNANKFNGKHKYFRERGHIKSHQGFNEKWDHLSKEMQCTGMRNCRDVWSIATSQFRDVHFATFPADLIRRPILAGSRPGGIVLDPFLGSGTTIVVALELGRKAIGIELNPEYADMARRRCYNVTPGFVL